MSIIFYISILISFLIGGIIAWLYASRKLAKSVSENELLAEKNNQLITDLQEIGLKLEKANEIANEYRSDREKVEIEKAKLESDFKNLTIKIEEQNQWKVDLLKAQEHIGKLDNERVRLEENLNAERIRINEQQENFKTQKEQLKSEFKNLANEILKDQSSNFASQSKKDIGDLIEPMKEKIEQFKKQVSDAYKEDERERYSLKNEIKSLLDLNKNLSEEAQNLSRALKGDNKTQGDWGEMILDTILENSGLTKGREYFLQQSITDDDNKRFRPDVIVQYPGNRCIIIDSKVSLKNYEAYINAKDEAERKIQLKAHIDSIKKHIKDLGSKNYQTVFKDCDSPEFVMMFLPIEPAYLIAVQNDAELWNNAYKKQILLISPTNLIAALRMIEELWEHDKQNKNVLKIAEESGKLVDKFIGFLDDFDKVGDYLKKSGDAFEKARNKIKDGRGNIVGKAKLISELGANTKKAIPQHYIEFDEE